MHSITDLLRVAAVSSVMMLIGCNASGHVGNSGLQARSQNHIVPVGPHVRLSGYVVILGQTALLFPSQATADEFDVSRCNNIGSDQETFSRITQFSGRHINLDAVNLGTSYATMARTGLGSHRLGNRNIEMYCFDDNIYWAISLDDARR